MKKYSRIFKYLGQFKPKLFLYFTFTLLATAFSIISLGMLAPFLTIIFNTDGNAASQQMFSSNAVMGFIKDMLDKQLAIGPMRAIIFICGLILASTILKNLFLYLSYVISSPMRSAITQRMRADMYDRLLTLPIGFFTDQRRGDIMSKMNNDVAEIEGSIISTLEGLIKDPLTIIGSLCYLAYLSPVLSLFLLILLPVTGFVIGRISRKLKKQSMEVAVKNGELFSVLDETLGGIRIIKAFTAEKLLRGKFFHVNDILYNLRVKMARRRDLASPLTEVLGVAVLCAILYFGGQLATGPDKSMPASDLITYIAVFATIINPAKNLSTAFFNLQKGSAAMQRVEELLVTVSQVKEVENGIALNTFKNAIEFKNVSFNYGEIPILKNINLKIEKGKTVALVGSSGAGKSTLADLVPRFHDVSGGELLIDGINIKEYSLQSLRSMIGMVTQEAILFNDTIAENILLGNPGSSNEAVIKAAQVANAHDFIIRKEEGYETNIGDRGNKLSGGERQRMTIARAVIKNPPILILDEATSALDTESERLVQDAINNLTQDRTSIVIAHRLSTIRHADEIIVLQKGEIVERGTHEALIAQNGFYNKLVEMQEFK